MPGRDLVFKSRVLLIVNICQRERERDRQTDRQTDRNREREREGWMDGWMVYCIINGLTITILNDDEHD